jgi:hypothetical protein
MPSGPLPQQNSTQKASILQFPHLARYLFAPLRIAMYRARIFDEASVLASWQVIEGRIKGRSVWPSLEEGVGELGSSTKNSASIL